MFAIGNIVRPTSAADLEYSVCGNSVLRKAEVIKTFDENENGNDMSIKVLEHVDSSKVGKHYKVNSNYFELAPEEPTPAPDEWIWVAAYKATQKDMTCKGHQYFMGENNFDGNPVLGAKGFHVCRELMHTFRKYPYDFHNRFFEVRALVNANDYHYLNPNNTTLVAKSVTFEEEVTRDMNTINAYFDFVNENA